VDRIVAGEERVDLRAALDELAVRHDVAVVRVDSGGTLNGVLLRTGLVHEVSLLVHPELVGGREPALHLPRPRPGGGGPTVALRLTHVERLRDDLVWLRYEVGR